jgi:hypothetical protein
LWTVDVASPATSRIRIAWNTQTNVGAGQTEWEYLRVLGWDDIDEVWESYGNANNSGDYSTMTVDFGQVLSSNTFSYSTNYITWGSINSSTTIFNALPVELISFEGEREGENSFLFWSTATETNSSHFEIERMENTNSWKNIGRVNASGYSRSRINYQFTDSEPSEGFNYYRLKMVDQDGKFEYSEIVNVYFEPKEKVSIDMSIFPNPINHRQLQFEIEGLDHPIDSDIMIFDLMGNMVDNRSKPVFNGIHELKLSENLASGVYILRVSTAQGVMKMRFVVN